MRLKNVILHLNIQTLWRNTCAKLSNNLIRQEIQQIFKGEVKDSKIGPKDLIHIQEEPQVTITIMEVHLTLNASKEIYKDMVELPILPKVTKGTHMGMEDIPPQLKHPQVLIKGQAHTLHPLGLMLHNHKLKSKRSQAWRSC
jgi:hypothetical protein